MSLTAFVTFIVAWGKKSKGMCIVHCASRIEYVFTFSKKGVKQTLPLRDPPAAQTRFSDPEYPESQK